MLVAREVGEGNDDEVHAEDVNAAGVIAKGVASVAGDDVNAAVKKPSILSPTPPTPPPQPSHDIPSTSQVQPTLPQSPQAQQPTPQPQPQPLQDAGISMNLLQSLMDTCTTLTRRVEHLEYDKVAQALEITKLKSKVKKLEKKIRIIENIYADEDVVLEEAKDVVADAKDGQDADVLIMQDDEASKPAKRQEVVEVVTTAKLITEAVTAASTTLTPATPQLTTAAAPTITVAPSFKMDYFKGMSYDDIRLIIENKFNSNVAFLMKTKEQINEEDSRALKRLNESKEDKALKKKKLDEEVEELKRHLQIVPNEEDVVYTEATPLAPKIPVVDYKIYNQNNKPYYKIKRADGTHQLYLSFLSMLKNFDKEDLEALWRLVKERFTTTKPKKVFDDFLLITLGAMFEKPDIHA
nr:hypothetical protein [Tanacetum cinerariifolium]